VATGGAPFRPPIKGIEHKNVMYLRSGADQAAIKAAATTSKNVVIIGTGFIGSEAASAMKMHLKDTAEVHIIGMTEVPMQMQLGPEVGGLIKKEHEKNGVKLHMLKSVTEIKGDGQNATSVLLNDGTEIKADLIIIGTGIVPSTQFLKDTDIKLDKQGGVICDPFLQTSNKDVFAAGDIAAHPYWLTGETVRIEHYITSQDQGSHAAFNMMGKLVPYGNIPFFWTKHYNKSIQFIGYNNGYERVHIEGDLADFKYLAYYIKGDKIVGIAGQGNSASILVYFEAMKQNLMPSATDLFSGKETVDSVKNRLKKNTGGSRCSRENCCSKKPAGL
jgi:NADPH-dependent 2,4-dienoyl-CoA reductase/sulfur reductase-like enzyme